MNEILQISPNLQKVSKAEGIRPNNNGKLAYFEIRFVRKLRTCDRLKTGYKGKKYV